MSDSVEARTRRTWMLVALVALACAASAVAQHDRAGEPAHPDSGLVERTRVSLILLDVEVEDAEGRPIRGLTKDEFRVTTGITDKAWPILSVDDLCPCEADSSASTSVPATGVEAMPESAGRVATAVDPRWSEAAKPRYVLYLDYSQLRQDGRHNAVQEARRWISEVMQPGDETMLAAYATGAGVVTLSGFTRDQQALLAAAERSYRDPQLVDPFPAQRELRFTDCQLCCERNTCVCEICWYLLASEHHSHTRRSFEALQTFLERLGSEPGRKALLLFHQDGTMFPARYYPLTEERGWFVGDLVRLTDDLGAEANLARTAIYAAYAGDADNRAAVNLGANLADATGGGYNRSSAGLSGVTDSARRDCACIYRLGLAVRDEEDRKLRRVTVEVRGRALEARYLVRHVGEGERWWRQSRAVLAEPARVLDVPLAAAVLPWARRGGRWEVKLQVALDAGAIGTLPQGTRQHGKWEVGALFSDAQGDRTWELLGVGELLRPSAAETTTVLLHEHEIAGLRPAAYELRAFVRDRLDLEWGGALAALDLPAAGEPALAGPVLLRGGARFVRTALPLRKDDRVEPERSAEAARGPVPLGPRSIVAGEPLEFVTLVCPGRGADTVEPPQRFVSREGQPLFRFEAPRRRPAGDCSAVHDELDTAPMAPGDYVYHVRWAGTSERTPDARVAFRIADPGDREPGAPAPGGAGAR